MNCKKEYEDLNKNGDYNNNNNIYQNNAKKHSSHNNNQSENNLLNDLDDVQKLKRLFLIYTGNEKKIHSLKFLKLLTDANLLDKDFDSKYADIVFFAASKSKTHLEFQGFCDIILKISEIKFPLDFIKNAALALNKILSNFLFPLLNKIYSNTNSNFNLSGLSPGKGLQTQSDYTNLILKINANSDIKEILEKHLYLIIKAYQKYFPWESLNISHDKKVNLSEKSFVKFCKDFEIQPNLISLVKLNDVYINSTLNSKIILSVVESVLDENIRNQGSFFTLFHFITCLYLISIQSILHFRQAPSSSRNTINYDENLSPVNDSNFKKRSFKEKIGSEVDYEIDNFAQGDDLSMNNLFG